MREILDRQARQKNDITEQELQAIAKAMYEVRLAEVCTLQRSTPYDVENHSAANLAFIDYFERLQNQGGRMAGDDDAIVFAGLPNFGQQVDVGLLDRLPGGDIARRGAEVAGGVSGHWTAPGGRERPPTTASAVQARMDTPAA